MDPQDLIKMLENRLAYNTQQRAAAFSRGDLSSVQSYDVDNAKTEASLAVLRAHLN